MELRWPLEVSPGREAPCRAVFGTWGSFPDDARAGHCPFVLVFNLYAEYIMRNARLDEAQAGIKIAGRNINNLRYSDDTTLMAESEEELKSLLMKVKVKSKQIGLKLTSKLRSWHLVPSLHGK